MAMKIAIIGGGVAGLAIARELSANPSYKVRLFEADGIGSGASGRAMGTITPFSDHDANDDTIEASIRSLSLLRKFISDCAPTGGANTLYRELGTLEVALSDSELSHLHERALTLPCEGTSFQLLERPELRRLMPALTEQAVGAILFPEEPEISVTQLLQNLRRKFMETGGEIAEGHKVTAIEGRHQSVYINCTHNIELFDLCIVCAGLGHNTISGIEHLPLIGVRGDIIRVRQPFNICNYNIYRGRAFVAPKADGSVLLGSNYDAVSDADHSAPTGATVESMSATLNAVNGIIPGANAWTFEEIWSGFRPKSSDNNPIVGPITNTNIVYVNGLHGLGFTLAFALAAMVREYLIGHDIIPPKFRAARFGT
jgi:glycine/D-amino acid oxidase-like deaminating enzyme